MEFIKNDLIDKTLTRFYETFRLTLDTGDFVSEKYQKKIEKYIFKNLKKKFSEVNKEYKKLLAEFVMKQTDTENRPKAESSAIECPQENVVALPDNLADGGDNLQIGG